MKLGEIKNLYFEGKLPKANYIERMFKIHKHLFDYPQFLKSTDIIKIEITDVGVFMTTRDGIKILCDGDDRRLAPIEVLNFNSYEKSELEMMLSLIEDGFCIFDIGANFGWYSLYFSKYFKKSNILAFEPVKRTFEYLLFNIKLNKTVNIKPYNIGLSNEEGEKIFYFRVKESVSASMKNLKDDKKAQEVVCKMVRLDDFVKDKRLRVDFIKCDVEGSELLVFKGAVDTISKDKPIIFTEMLRKWSAKFGYHPNEIIQLLKKMGYECFKIDSGSLRKVSRITDDTIETNFFFLHLKKHLPKIKRFSL